MKENTFVDIGAAEIARIVEGESPEEVIAIRTASKELLEDDWVKENQSLDRKLEDKIEVLKNSGQDLRDIREELKEEVIEIKEDVKKQEPQELELPKEETINKAPSRTVIPTTTNSPTRFAIQIRELVIIPAAVTASVIEGQTVAFKAQLLFSDGSRQDVTTTTQWRIVGDIGSISSSGVFTAKMRDEDSEIAMVKGFVQAVITRDGVSLESNATLMTVEHLVIPETNLEG